MCVLQVLRGLSDVVVTGPDSTAVLCTLQTKRRVLHFINAVGHIDAFRLVQLTDDWL